MGLIINGRKQVELVNGVGPEYSKMTETGGIFPIAKGQLNKLRLRPAIISEQQESSREVLETVTATKSVGQFFKASQDNINSISLTMESAAGSPIDNFESYADSLALQAVWILAGTNEALLESTIVRQGLQSMALPGDIVNDTWVKTIGAVNYEDDIISLSWRQNDTYIRSQYEFFVGDGTYTKHFALNVGVLQNQWFHFDIDVAGMIEDDLVNPVNDSAITKIGIRVAKKFAGATGYVDNIIVSPPPGKIGIELWDFGTTLPTGDGTEDYTAIGTQYTEIGDRGISANLVSTLEMDLQGGFRFYNIIPVVAGVALEIPDNTLLNVGNYYGLVLKYIDTEVDIYGANTTFGNDYYQNGYAWKAEVADDFIDKIPGAAGAGAFSDLMFYIYSTQDVYIVDVETKLDAVAFSQAQFSIFTEDKNMKTGDLISQNESQFGDEHLEDLSLRPVFLAKGGKLEMNYNDDYTDEVEQISFVFEYLFIPPTING